jgi:hypothetical protein
MFFPACRGSKGWDRGSKEGNRFRTVEDRGSRFPRRGAAGGSCTTGTPSHCMRFALCGSRTALCGLNTSLCTTGPCVCTPGSSLCSFAFRPWCARSSVCGSESCACGLRGPACGTGAFAPSLHSPMCGSRPVLCSMRPFVSRTPILPVLHRNRKPRSPDCRKQIFSPRMRHQPLCRHNGRLRPRDRWLRFIDRACVVDGQG